MFMENVGKYTVRPMDPMGIEGEDIHSVLISLPDLGKHTASQLNLAEGRYDQQTKHQLICYFKKKTTPTHTVNIPQTLNHLFMKEILFMGT